ncbi:MAG: BrnT family toxin [Chloracidobacterium sp.]|nr:BrnT family toxin [Chloracidobacterium sp.]
MQFEWDQEKAALNLRKHGVGFDEAKTVWDDLFHIDLFDHLHSVDENRFLMVGESSSGRLLIISYTERENRVRIISVRELTPRERRDYEHGYFE